MNGRVDGYDALITVSLRTFNGDIASGVGCFLFKSVTIGLLPFQTKEFLADERYFNLKG